jgi:hypothetical protein
MHRIDTKRAAELRASGMTWREVGHAFGHKSCTGLLGALKRDGLFVRSNKVCVRKQKDQASPASHLPDGLGTVLPCAP